MLKDDKKTLGGFAEVNKRADEKFARLQESIGSSFNPRTTFTIRNRKDYIQHKEKPKAA